MLLLANKPHKGSQLLPARERSIISSSVGVGMVAAGQQTLQRLTAAACTLAEHHWWFSEHWHGRCWLSHLMNTCTCCLQAQYCDAAEQAMGGGTTVNTLQHMRLQWPHKAMGVSGFDWPAMADVSAEKSS